MLTATATMTPEAGGLLIDSLLRRQREPTAVERFARHHAANSGGAAPPAMERYYRDLLPLSAPGPGQQYAFEVDLDACSGCKACVAACHSLNGLDEDETWRDVGVLVGGTTALLLLGVVVTAVSMLALVVRFAPEAEAQYRRELDLSATAVPEPVLA